MRSGCVLLNAALRPPLHLPRSPTADRSHFAYNVRNREGGDNDWMRIGSAWAHADGNGFNTQLEAVPLDELIILRVVSEKKE